MANLKSLQLLRNTKVFSTKEAAIAYLNEKTPTSDGTPILARYEGELEDGTKVIKTLLGLQAMADGFEGEVSGGSYTTIIDVEGTDEDIQNIIERLDNVASALTADTGVIKEDSKTLEEVLQDILDEVKENQVNETGDGADGSIAVTENESGTTLSVVIQEGDTVIANSGTGLYTDIKIEHDEDAEAESNVREAFKLTGTDGSKLGQTIKIYKDSSLYTVYLGHVDDALEGADEKGESESHEVIEGSGDTSLNFIYQVSSGKYKLVAVNVEEFLSESEFKDGLEVVNESGYTGNVVKVKIDENSETVSTGEGAANVAVLSVSQSGVKVSNIQSAIDSKAVTAVSLTSQDVAADVTIERAEDGSGVSISIEQGGNVIKLTGYEPRELGDGEELKVGETDTVNVAVAKLEAAINNNEKVTSEAIINLQEQLDEISTSGVTNVVELTGDETIAEYQNPGNGIVIEKEGSVVKLGLDVTKVEGIFDFGQYSID